MAAEEEVRMRWSVVMAVAVAAAAGVGGSARGFTITPTFYDGAGQTWNATEEAVVNAAIESWTSRLSIPGAVQDIPINFEFIHGNGELAYWSGEPLTLPTGTNPTTAGINHLVAINVDLMDTSLPYYMSFTLGDVAQNNWDALSVLRHELGHALGFTTLYTDGNGQGVWQKHVTVSGGVATFDAGGLNLVLDGPTNESHVSSVGEGASDLMSSFLPNGVRKDVSAADVAALSLAYGFAAVPEPGTVGVLGLGVVGMLLRRRATTAAT
jgi:hypothetical protein